MLAMVPYMAGKLLIEQPGVRIEAIKRFVTLLAVVSVLSVAEFLKKANLLKFSGASSFQTNGGYCIYRFAMDLGESGLFMEEPNTPA